MPNFTTEPLFDEATLKRMDEVFLASQYDDLKLPEVLPLDPWTDPFGMNYEWLGPPGEFEAEIAAEKPKA